MRRYELAIIFKDKGNVDEPLNKVKELLTKNGALITDEDRWGSRELAYPIKKQNTGYYVIFTLNAEPSAIGTINKKLLLEGNVLRHLFIKISEQR